MSHSARLPLVPRSEGLALLNRVAAVLGVVLVWVCGAPSSARAAEPGVPLALKFTAGETLQYDLTFSGGGGVSVPGAEVSAVGIQGSLSMAQKILEVLPDGSARLETTIPRIQVEVTIGEDKASFSFADGKLRWFANGKEHTPPDETVLRTIPLLMTPMVVTVAPDGRTTGLGLSDPQALSQLSQAVPGLDLSRLVGESAPVLPGRPVSVGATWGQNVQLYPLGPAMPVTVSISRTLDAFDEHGGVGVARISGFSDTRVRAAEPLAVPGGFTVSIPEIRQTVTSTEFLNTTKGQLLRGDYDVGLRASFALKIAEEEKPGSIEARLRVSLQAR